MNQVELLPCLLNGRPYVADNNIAVTDDGQAVLLEDWPVVRKYGSQ